MYQALYRKYRPSTFDEVVGQDVIIKTLKNEVKLKKLSHAYLFTGPRGTGKTSVAKILAKTVNCEDLKDFSPCNVCVNCTQINNKQSTDIIEIDAASNNGVDEIRELRSKVNLVPSFGKYKVYIIDEVHMLTVGAFNALLKTLEEPPAHVIFILATTDPHKLPNTILSRCQRFDFKRISENKIVERLKEIVKLEDIKIEEEALAEIARLSDGGMRDSISMLDQVVSYAEKEITLKDVHEVNGTITGEEIGKIVLSIKKKDAKYLFDSFDQFEDDGKNFIKLTEEIIHFLRNLLLLQTVPKYFEENNKEKSTYKEFQKEISLNEALKWIFELNHSLSEMKMTRNPKMVLELTFIKLLNGDFINEKIESKEPLEIKKEESNREKLGTSKKEDFQEKKELESAKKFLVKRKTESINEKVLKKGMKRRLQEIIDVRINNALAGFSRKEVQELKKKEDSLHNYLLNPEDGKYVSMIFDGEMKAVGNHTIIYVFPTEKLSTLFNESILKIDEILTKNFEEEYHGCSTYIERWNEIKIEFNNKKKVYTYEEEKIDANDLFEDKKMESSNEVESLFGELVEYQ